MSAGPFNELVEETWTRVQELMSSTDGWAPISTIPANVQDSYLRELPGSSIKIVRATGRAKASAEAISTLLWSETKEVKQSEDDTLLEHLYVEEFGPDANVIYQLYSLPWPLANREICCIKAIRRTADGTIYHVNHSVEHPKCPTSSKVVRAQVSNCSYIFKPISDTETEVTYIVAFDPMGSIPKWLVNRNTSKVAERVSQVIIKAESLAK